MEHVVIDIPSEGARGEIHSVSPVLGHERSGLDHAKEGVEWQK
jgi:hypothetical protein